MAVTGFERGTLIQDRRERRGLNSPKKTTAYRLESIVTVYLWPSADISGVFQIGCIAHGETWLSYKRARS